MCQACQNPQDGPNSFRALGAEDDRAGVLASFVGGLAARDERLLRELLGPDLAAGEAGRRPARPDR